MPQLSRNTFRWFPRSIFLVLALLSLIVSYFLLLESRRFQENQISLQKDKEASLLELENQTDSIENFVSVLAEEYNKNNYDQFRFMNEVKRFVTDHPAVDRVAFVSPQYKERWKISSLNSPSLLDIPFLSRELFMALEQARSSQEATYSDPFNTLNGDHALAIVVPVFQDDDFRGFLYASISLGRFLTSALPRWIKEEYQVSLSNGKGYALAKLNATKKVDVKLSSKASFKIGQGDYQLVLVREDNGVDWQLVLLSALGIGVVIGVSISVVDLARDNARKHAIAQEFARAKDLAVQANAEKSLFLATMSHELRTPLGAVIGYADLLQDNSLDPNEGKRFLQGLSANAKNLLHLVNDILDLAKIESGSLMVVTEPIALLDFIHDIAAAMEPMAATKGLLFEISFAWPLPEHFVTDPKRLSQILLNLLSNAIKFTEKGSVTMAISVANTTANATRTDLTFKVTDTGIGMSVDQQSRIFRNFAQADQTISRKYGGTGLGLALSQKIAEQLQGQLLLSESTVDAGSVFTLTMTVPLPPDVTWLKEGAAFVARPSPIVLSERKLAGCRILLVEDYRDNQIILTHLFQHEGAIVSLAANGSEALAKADTLDQDFDCVIMDIQLPDGNGYEVTQVLRQQGCTIPILALTAHALKHERELALAAGCNDYLTKPIDFDWLIATVRRFYKPSAETPAHVVVPVLSSLRHDPRFEHLIPQYVRGLDARLADLAKTLGTESLNDSQRILHQLKGSSGLYGFAELRYLCEKWDDKLTDGRWSPDETATLLTELSDMKRRMDLGLSAS